MHRGVIMKDDTDGTPSLEKMRDKAVGVAGALAGGYFGIFKGLARATVKNFTTPSKDHFEDGFNLKNIGKSVLEDVILPLSDMITMVAEDAIDCGKKGQKFGEKNAATIQSIAMFSMAADGLVGRHSHSAQDQTKAVENQSKETS